MDTKGLLFIFLWMHVLNGIRGRYIPKHANKEKMAQNISYVNGLAEATPQSFLFSQNKEIARDASNSIFFNVQNKLIGDPDVVHHWAVNIIDGELYGIKAVMSVYGVPTTNNGQTSSCQIWVVNGVYGQSINYNAIQVGWHVKPHFYGDHETHFFTYWTGDGLQTTGCLNLNCPGFRLDPSSPVVPGQIIGPLSQYNREQKFFSIMISREQESGDWWLYYGPNGVNYPVGYWPSSLFSTLKYSASQIQYGGSVSYVRNCDGGGPPMGSGHFAMEGEHRAASIRKVLLANKYGELLRAEDYNQSLLADEKICYTAALGHDTLGEQVLFLGGPGGCNA